MRILAESKPVAVIPFVHLGYLAASYIRPQGGLTLAGTILAVAGMGMAFRVIKGLSARGKAQTQIWLRRSRVGVLGVGTLLLGIACVLVAWVSGDRYYPHGAEMTSIQMMRALDFIDANVEDMANGYSGQPGNPIRRPPVEPGEYDLGALALEGLKPRAFPDGWMVPMKLKVVRTAAQELDYIVLSAGEDRKWHTEDDIASQSWAERRRQAEEALASRASGQ